MIPALSVVVPVYNSASTIPVLVDRLGRVLPAIAERFEAVLVDDGSRDGSWPAIEAAVRSNPWIRGVSLMRNYGQHNALLSGIRQARCDVIVTIDDDLQNPPEEIPLLLDALARGADVVYGAPREQHYGFWRNAASVVVKLILQGVIGATAARSVSAFRAFRAPLRDAFADYHGPYVNIDVLLTWATSEFAAVPVRHEARHAGASHYGLRRLFTHTLNLVTGFSAIPLQIVSVLGFVLTIFGLALLTYVLGRYAIQGGVVPGFTFLASVIVIFSGAQLFTLGVIGEYLARMHFRMMGRPPYAIRRVAES